MARREWRCSAGLLLVAALTGCGNGDSQEKFGGPTMGSRYSIQYVRHAGLPGPVQVRQQVEAILSEVDQQLSTYRSDSDIERFNALPANSCQPMPAPVLQLVEVGEQLSRASEGGYDLTVGPLMNLWGFGPQARTVQVPSEPALAQVRQRVGYQHLRIDAQQLCKDAPVEVDFDSIAAGYTVDRIAAALGGMGITSFLVEVTGELKVVGTKLDGNPWKIALEEPRDDKQVVERVLTLDGYGVSTSGDYRNYFEQGGRRYAHTFDARSGVPVLHDLAAVTVVAPQALMADGWSTLLLILGPERGMEYAEKHAIAAFFVMRTDGGFVTRSSQAFIRLSGENAP